MIAYYSIDPETKEKTLVARFRLRDDGAVEVLTDKPGTVRRFAEITVDGPSGPRALRPEDGQAFLDGLLELNHTRTYAWVVDESLRKA